MPCRSMTVEPSGPAAALIFVASVTVTSAATGVFLSDTSETAVSEDRSDEPEGELVDEFVEHAVSAPAPRMVTATAAIRLRKGAGCEEARNNDRLDKIISPNFST